MVDARVCILLDLDASIEGAALERATLVVARKGAITARDAVARLLDLHALLGDAIPILVAGRVDLALAAGCGGVVLGREDLSPKDARRLLGTRALLGMEVHEPGHADELYRWPIDFALVGGAEDSAASPARPGDAAAIARMTFRIRLAAPGTPATVVTDPDPDLAGALIRAGADGIAYKYEGGSAQTGRRLRASVDEALAARTGQRPS